MYKVLTLLSLVMLVLLAPIAAAAAGKTEVTWYGQSAFKITTPSGKVLLVDPWIENPSHPAGKQVLAKLEKADLILISHGHNDHVGNAVEIAKKTKARLVAPVSLGMALVRLGGFPKEQVSYDTLGNFGGELELLGGEVKVAFIPAVHDSDMTAPVAVGQTATQAAAGNPAGFLITIKGGPAIYHTGDTDLFSDMSLIKEFRRVDLMLACIGDHFTMGPRRAAAAVKLVDPKMVVPMHYGTFPMLTGTPDEFAKELGRLGLGSRMKKLVVGETLVW